ncbi:MAG TPA: SusC/RagA family TonB-linked outer membrane protein [Puia sp.]|nr:SusC/RagA family TonB-linked outer membrane protein [Puia sp.]
MTIKRLLRQFTLLLLCVILTQIAFSQTKTISGKIFDEKGVPIQGATVTVRGSKAGTSTNVSGAFTLNVPATAKTLVISSVGFTQQEIAIGDKESFEISLAASTQSLTDVVVIGYGSAQRKDVTGSVASVKAKDFDKGAIAPEELLIGKVAGLQVADNSGQPGGTTITKIRGNNSIVSGNNPLYVVDGIPIDATSPLPPNLITGIGSSVSNNPLLFLNPGDISQIDILKDASSAAIYGARGENGVVLITLNKGNGKMNIDAGVTVGTYAGLMKKADILSAGQYRSELGVYGFKSDSGLSIDPFKAILQNKTSTVYSVALSGGGENGKFRASFSASDKTGIILKSGLQQYNASFSGEHYFLDKKLKINFEFIGSNYTLQSAPISTNPGSTGNLISAAMNWNPTLALVENGVYNQKNPSGQINPLALSAYTDDYSHVTQLLGIAGVTYKIFPGLTYNFLYGISSAAATRDAQLQGYIAATGSSYDGHGAGQTSNGSLTTQTLTHTLTYEKKLKNSLNFRILAGYEYYETSNLNFKFTTDWGYSFNAPGKPNYPDITYYNDMGAGTQANLSTGSNAPPKSELQSYFGRGEVNYADKYFITATVRDDGSTKFGVNNRYVVFPSFGFRWDILNEEFMKKATFLNTLGLRLGWGQVGGQDGLQAGFSQQLGTPGSGGVGVQHYGNSSLKWETLTSANGGIDFGFLNNRVFGYVDYFSKKTTDPLFPGTLSQPSQGATIWKNLPGYITNKGFEFSIGIAIIRSKDLTWNISGNFEYVKNKFVYPALGSSPLYLTGGVNGQGVSSAYAQAIANNQPIDVFYLRTFQGFDQNGIAIVKSQASGYVGDPNPHVILGLNTDVTYKKLSLSINTHGQFGNKIFNNTLVSVTNLGNIANGKNISKTLIGTQESLANPVSASTRFLQSGNFVKLGNATLSYNLGSFGNIIKGSRVFISGSNLFEITKYTGFDAEVNQDHNNNGIPSLGMDYIGYPTARSITFGLTFSLY